MLSCDTIKCRYIGICKMQNGGLSMLKHYVEYFYRYRKEFKLYEQIAERDPKLVNVPKNACAYRFFDVDRTGKICIFSGMTYFGKVYTL